MFIQGTDTVRVDWSPVPPQYTNGVLLGYKVLYSDVNDRSRVNSSLISPNKTYLNIKGLKTNTNYSFQVLAFTAKGNGVRSAAYFARTSSGILKLGTFSLCCYTYMFGRGLNSTYYSSYNKVFLPLFNSAIFFSNVCGILTEVTESIRLMRRNIDAIFI